MGEVSEEKAYSNYIKSSEFETTKCFEQKNISVTRPTLENISVTRPTQFFSLTRPTEFKPVTRPTESQKKLKKGTYQMTRIHTYHRHTCNQRKINVIRKKSVRNTGKMTCQTHHQASIPIRLTTVITDASNVRRKAIGKRIRKNMRTFNSKFSDGSI